MYEEMIQRLNPKPRFDLRWYKNEDAYSDGDTEDLNINIIAENEPEDYVDEIANNFCWPVYYHLTHTRKNILNWYPFDKEASVLEIGCGIGAITSVLCDRCRDVTAVELSKRRATGALLRCREKENLEIIVGNLNDIEFEKKFDYITLIGVLEYQGSYTETENPYEDFLKKIRSLLKPDGRLLIAIENQYGLKYWCGAREDHTSIPFEGMNQYRISGNKVRTFSKAALEQLVKQSGFKKTFFYYPMPDYKLPTVIYSERCLPKNANMMNAEYYYIPDSRTLVADEKKIYADLIDNNVFDFFANSFFLECTEEGEVGQITFAALNSSRLPEYQVGTRFTKDGKVEKFSMGLENGLNHMCQILENEDNLEKHGISVWKSRLVENMLVSDYCPKRTLEEVVLEAYRKKDIPEILDLFDKVYEEIIKSSDEVREEDNILYTFGIANKENGKNYGPVLKEGYIDMILRNAFVDTDRICWFDQEWILKNVPAKYIISRAIVLFYNSYKELETVLSISVLRDRYGLTDIWDELQALESLFIGVVVDRMHLVESKGFKGDVDADCLKNLQKIIK